MIQKIIAHDYAKMKYKGKLKNKSACIHFKSWNSWKYYFRAKSFFPRQQSSLDHVKYCRNVNLLLFYLLSHLN